MNHRLLVLCFLCITVFSAKAQYSIEGLSLSDSSSLWFDEHIGISSTELLTGTDGSYRLISKRSHPFFFKNRWVSGSVVYRDEQFTNIMLMYNILESELLLFDPGQNRVIKLDKQQLSSFHLEDHYFRRLPDSFSDNDRKFYEIVSEQELFSIYVKRDKNIVIKHQKQEYVSKNKYFVLINGNMKEINALSGILKEFDKTDRKDIRIYAINNGIKPLRKASVSQLRSLSQFCNQKLVNK